MSLAVLATALALVPLPPQYTVHHMPCPEAGGSCATYDGQIYLAPGHSRFARWHEFGHVFDAKVLSDGDRNWLAPLLVPGRSWYEGYSSPMEFFADAYSACALGLSPKGPTWVNSYGYAPHPKRHRRICAAMRRIGDRAGLPSRGARNG
jgi:hypothetical protein